MSHVYLGQGAVKNLQNIIITNNYKRAFLVTNKNSFTLSGMDRIIHSYLHDAKTHRFCDYSVNPKAQDVIKGIKEINNFRPDIIIGVGGGSAMDMAKLLNTYATQDYNKVEQIQEHIKTKRPYKKLAPLICIPTTSGSGSEATQFAVIYINKVKYSIDHQNLSPDYCIVDPALSLKLPKKITAYTGMDALAQAIESFWAKKANFESKEYALKAINMVYNNLIDAVHRPNLQNRDMLAQGAYFAGKAINITRTTAPHALSYYITTHHNIPHGHAVALTLPYFLVENAQHSDLSEVYRILGVNSSADAKQAILKLMQEIELETSFKKLNIHNVESIVDSVNLERLKNNPKDMTRDDLVNILSSIN